MKDRTICPIVVAHLMEFTIICSVRFCEFFISCMEGMEVLRRSAFYLWTSN